MAERISVNIATATAELDKLKSAIDIFKPYTEGFAQAQRNKLGDSRKLQPAANDPLGADPSSWCNSDFIVELDLLLRALKDDSGQQLLQDIETYHTNASTAIGAIKDTDQELANAMGGE